MLKIVIADDHSLFRRGVKDLLADGLGSVTYRARILEKLHLKNNAELMRYAVQQGIA